jgi:hypothetical protein
MDYATTPTIGATWQTTYLGTVTRTNYATH